MKQKTIPMNQSQDFTELMDDLRQVTTVEGACEMIDKIGLYYLPDGMATSWVMAEVFMDGLFEGIKMVQRTMTTPVVMPNREHAWVFLLNHEADIRQAYHERHMPKLPNTKE